VQIDQQISDKMGGMGHFRINAQTLYVMGNILKIRGILEMLCQPGKGGEVLVIIQNGDYQRSILLDTEKLFKAMFDCDVNITIHQTELKTYNHDTIKVGIKCF